MTGKVILVTGGARGIGKALCDVFGSAGGQVALCDVDLDQATQTRQELVDQGHAVEAFRLDVRDRQAWKAVVQTISEQMGPIDILIGNAGIMPAGPFLSLSPAEESRQVDINLNGLIYGVHAVLPQMQARGGGHIVHIASIAGRIPTPFGAVYAATKFGAVGLTESLRHELHGTGIQMTTVMPGFVQTELVSGLATPAWPKPLSPECVARATLRGVIKKKGRVFVPWFAGLLTILPWIAPHWMNIWLSRLFGVHTVLKPVDASARLAYKKRTMEEP